MERECMYVCVCVCQAMGEEHKSVQKLPALHNTLLRGVINFRLLGSHKGSACKKGILIIFTVDTIFQSSRHGPPQRGYRFVQR